MPRRKISIEEALSTLREAGMAISISKVEPVESIEPVKKGFKNPVYPMDDYTIVKPTVHNQFMKITLWAKHTIGQGGSLTDDGVTEETNMVTYGPGVVTVPTKDAQYLLHQDMLARQQDDRFLDRTQRSYLVVSGVRSDGSRSIVGKAVDDSVLDGFSLNNTPAIIL